MTVTLPDHRALGPISAHRLIMRSCATVMSLQNAGPLWSPMTHEIEMISLSIIPSLNDGTPMRRG